MGCSILFEFLFTFGIGAAYCEMGINHERLIQEDCCICFPPPPKIKGYIEILALWITCHIHCKAGMCKGGAAKTVMKMEREKATPSVM